MEPINLTIELEGDWTSKESVRLKTAFDCAMQDESKLSNGVLTMEGMSGNKYRRLINKFVELTPDARYLEIGSWAGSTACSAMYGNKCKVMCIDNWLHFGGPKDQFFQNIDTFGNDDIDFNYAESDYADVDYSQIGKFNIYLFDGPHEEHHQYAGIVSTQAALDDTYLLVVDDWNWVGVRNGTLNALNTVGNTVVSSIVVRTTQNEIHPTISGAASEWHNGYFIAVIKK
jgi:hypothetical protein